MGVARLQIYPPLLLQFLLPGHKAELRDIEVSLENDRAVLTLVVAGDTMPDSVIEPVYDDQSAHGLPPRLVSLSVDEDLSERARNNR